MKRCYLCKLEKPLDEFHKCATRKDGLQTKCIPCQREYQRIRRSTAEGKEYDRIRRKIYNSKLSTKELRKEAQRRYRATDYGKSKTKERSLRFRQTQTFKVAAHSKFKSAIKSGLISRQPCEICGKSPADGHHFDYSKPLDVRWLCRLHHAKEHQQCR